MYAYAIPDIVPGGKQYMTWSASRLAELTLNLASSALLISSLITLSPSLVEEGTITVVAPVFVVAD